MGSNTPNLSLYKPDSGENNWASQHNANWDTMDDNVPYEIATGTITASGGSSPAVNTTIAGVSTDQTAALDLVVFVDSDPAFNADYAFNYDYSQQWDDTNGEVDIEITVNWDTDPGGGNDVTLRYTVQDRNI